MVILLQQIWRGPLQIPLPVILLGFIWLQELSDDAYLAPLDVIIKREATKIFYKMNSREEWIFETW